jgi:hypothetical protein
LKKWAGGKGGKGEITLCGMGESEEGRGKNFSSNMLELYIQRIFADD